MKKVVLLIIFVFSFAPLNSYGMMRCGKKLVSTGESKGTVVAICGKPFYKAGGGEKQKGRSTTRGRIKITGKNSAKYKERTRSSQTTDTIEKWYYDFGPRYFIYVLTFKNELLEKINTTTTRGKVVNKNSKAAGGSSANASVDNHRRERAQKRSGGYYSN